VIWDHWLKLQLQNIGSYIKEYAYKSRLIIRLLTKWILYISHRTDEEEQSYRIISYICVCVPYIHSFIIMIASSARVKGISFF